MSDYAIKNIKELEDSAVQFGLSPQVEARFGRKALDAQKGGVSYQRSRRTTGSRSATRTSSRRRST